MWKPILLCLSLIASLILGPSRARADPTGEDEQERADCALGVLAWCWVESDRVAVGPPPRARVEAFGGYKLSNLYYRDEIRSCEAAGCALDFAGVAFGVDGFYNLSGDPRTADYLALGVSASYMPIVSEITNNARGFDGPQGFIEPGDGRLGYATLRLSLRRGHFLYLIKSKYLISSFGVGAAIPVSSGAGASFTGADAVKITLGGKLGAEYPLTERLKLGVATNWSVIWFGDSFGDASFSSSYGLNLTVLL